MTWRYYRDWKDDIPLLNNFGDVERLYNATKPIVSRNHTEEDDIRPYGKRSHKHRRIVKVSRDCYVITTCGESLPSAYDMERDRARVLAERYGASLNSRDLAQRMDARIQRALSVPKSHYEKYGCVVWRRHRDGSQTLRLRNSFYPNRNTHLMSLREVLPRFVRLSDRRSRGGHYLTYREKTLFFPLSKKVSPYWQARYANDWSTREDGRYIEFRRDAGMLEWTLTHHCEEFKTAMYVDREAKAPYRESMRKFVDWCVVTHNMLGHSGIIPAYHDIALEDSKAITECTQVDRRRIISDEDHPLRWAFAMHLLVTDNTQTYSPWYTSEMTQPFQVRQRNNLTRMLNKLLGFVKED